MTFVYKPMNDDKKDSPDEGSSSSSNKSKKEQELLKLQQMRTHLHGRQKSRMLLEQMDPKEQEEFAQDMYSQMRQLKEHNEAMGYHEYSAFLRRQSQVSTEFETEVETDADFDININIKTQKTRPKLSKHHKGSNSIVLSETAALKQKLENISSSINQMR
eukprot:407731_1